MNLQIGDRVQLLSTNRWYEIIDFFVADYGKFGKEDWALIIDPQTGQQAKWKVCQLQPETHEPLKFEILNISDPGVLERVRTKNAIYCGRENSKLRLAQSPVANHYVLGRDGDRNAVCDKFEADMWVAIGQADLSGIDRLNLPIKARSLLDSQPLLAGLLYLMIPPLSGRPLNLACYCAPKRCHCEALTFGVLYLISVLNQTAK